MKGPYTSANSANNIRIELKRRGFMVTCKITMLAQFPGSGEYGPFNEVKIPVDIDRLWISLLPIVKFQDLTYLEREDTA